MSSSLFIIPLFVSSGLSLLFVFVITLMFASVFFFGGGGVVLFLFFCFLFFVFFVFGDGLLLKRTEEAPAVT